MKTKFKFVLSLITTGLLLTSCGGGEFSPIVDAATHVIEKVDLNAHVEETYEKINKGDYKFEKIDLSDYDYMVYSAPEGLGTVNLRSENKALQKGLQFAFDVYLTNFTSKYSSYDEQNEKKSEFKESLRDNLEGLGYEFDAEASITYLIQNGGSMDIYINEEENSAIYVQGIYDEYGMPMEGAWTIVVQDLIAAEKQQK